MTGSKRSLPRKRVPGYLFHKATGQARVRINGKDYYLGPYGSEESRVEYGELIAQHASGVLTDPLVPADESKGEPGLSVNELCAAFMYHADKHYLKDGEPTSEIGCLKLAISPLVDLYGATPVSEFGPKSLKAVRAKMIDKKWARNSINKMVGRIRSIFKWGVAEELLDVKIHQALVTVAPLLAGRTEAKDNPPRTPVTDEHINIVREEVRPLVRDMIDVQKLTGARSGELLKLTKGIIDQSGPVWSAEIKSHKTIHHGLKRTLYFGPKAQEIMARYLKVTRSPKEPLFKMTRSAYRRAITRACELRGIPRWVPHQLRHTTATAIRELFDLDHSQATLGHATADMTEHYAKVSKEKAIAVALRLG